MDLSFGSVQDVFSARDLKEHSQLSQSGSSLSGYHLSVMIIRVFKKEHDSIAQSLTGAGNLRSCVDWRKATQLKLSVEVQKPKRSIQRQKVKVSTPEISWELQQVRLNEGVVCKLRDVDTRRVARSLCPSSQRGLRGECFYYRKRWRPAPSKIKHKLRETKFVESEIKPEGDYATLEGNAFMDLNSI